VNKIFWQAERVARSGGPFFFISVFPALARSRPATRRPNVGGAHRTALARRPPAAARRQDAARSRRPLPTPGSCACLTTPPPESERGCALAIGPRALRAVAGLPAPLSVASLRHQAGEANSQSIPSLCNPQRSWLARRGVDLSISAKATQWTDSTLVALPKKRARIQVI